MMFLYRILDIRYEFGICTHGRGGRVRYLYLTGLPEETLAEHNGGIEAGAKHMRNELLVP